MRRLLVLGLLLAGCAQPAQPPATPAPTPAVTTPAETWIPFTAPDGSFSVLLPASVDIQEDEDGFEVASRAEPGAQVEIDLERFPNAKLAGKRHEEKIKDARTGPLKGEKREGNRVILSLADSKGAPFTNVLILSGTRVIDIMFVGDEADVQKLLASLELKDPK